VTANIEGIGKVGGIVGATYGWGGKKFICCYTNGTLAASGYYSDIAGYCDGGSTTSIMTYTTMQCENSEFKPTGSHEVNCYSIYDTDNIAQKMEEAYSDYADYWNFDNTWTWSGKVNGKQKSVKCPRLAWE
jgi:hypothetical protein